MPPLLGEAEGAEAALVEGGAQGGAEGGRGGVLGEEELGEACAGRRQARRREGVPPQAETPRERGEAAGRGAGQCRGEAEDLRRPGVGEAAAVAHWTHSTRATLTAWVTHWQERL